MASLAKSGYEVHSADIRDMPFGLKSRFVHSHHVVRNETPEAYAQSFLDLVRKIQPDAVLPIGSRAVAGTALKRDCLDQLTAVSIPESGMIAAANDKAISMQWCASLGIPHARVYSGDEAERAIVDDGVSLVVKPGANIGAARGVSYVQNVIELASAVKRCRELYGRELIQEYVPGGSDAMKTAILLFSPESELIAAFTTRKKRQWPVTGGLTVTSHSTSDAAIVTQMLPLFEKWKWKGPVEVEFKCDAVSSTDKVIEINPRFPAYLRFAQKCGLDLATLAVRTTLRHRVELRKYPAYSLGVTYMNPGLMLKAAAWSARNTGVSEMSGLASEFRHGFPFVLEMLRDPAPFIGRAIEDLKRSRAS
jgi:D-aspartate ligase